MVNNGTLHYDHDRDGTHTELAGCEVKLRNVYYDTSLSIRYEKDTLSGIYICNSTILNEIKVFRDARNFKRM